MASTGDNKGKAQPVAFSASGIYSSGKSKSGAILAIDFRAWMRIFRAPEYLCGLEIPLVAIRLLRFRHG
jgi:hypothetical protein